jgi:DNA-3-methyladenine glycosylase
MSAPARRPVPRSFFARDTVAVARALIGCTLWTESAGETCAGRIVEAEAYLDQRDPASHAATGPTPRSRVMFGPPGVLYVYLIYGMHHCLNLVTERQGQAGAVLIRALEPLLGLPAMHRRRAGATRRALDDRRLCAGPGRLCRALGVDLGWNGLRLGRARPAPAQPPAGRRVWVAAGLPPPQVVSGPRIGIRQAVAMPWRFWDPTSPCLSQDPARGRL